MRSKSLKVNLATVFVTKVQQALKDTKLRPCLNKKIQLTLISLVDIMMECKWQMQDLQRPLLKNLRPQGKNNLVSRMKRNKETHRKRLEKVLKLQCLTTLQMYLLLQVRIRATRKFVMFIINSLNLVCISGQQAWYSSSKKDEHQTNSQYVIFTTHLPNISWEKYTFGALLHNTPYAIHGNTQLCWNQTSPPPHIKK